MEIQRRLTNEKTPENPSFVTGGRILSNVFGKIYYSKHFFQDFELFTVVNNSIIFWYTKVAFYDSGGSENFFSCHLPPCAPEKYPRLEMRVVKSEQILD